MDWFIAAPFVRSSDDPWLGRFVPASDASFISVPATYAHDRSRAGTDLQGWRDYWRHGGAAWNAVHRHPSRAGVLTCFPQLPLTIGLRKRVSRYKPPLVAWTFNLGTLPMGWRRQVALAGLSCVDRFVVHSRAECRACSEWLQLPKERFEFVPLQRPVRAIGEAEDRNDPFVLSMGSAKRDYRLLFAVLAELGYRAIVVAAPHAVSDLKRPPNVELRSALTIDECHALSQRARLNVIPVANAETASGQVTMLDAMMLARAVIVTAGPASNDYATHGTDAWLVRAGDHDDLKIAIQRLWEDEPTRVALGTAARRAVVERFSDEAVGAELGRVLRQVEALS